MFITFNHDTATGLLVYVVMVVIRLARILPQFYFDSYGGFYFKEIS